MAARENRREVEIWEATREIDNQVLELGDNIAVLPWNDWIGMEGALGVED